MGLVSFFSSCVDVDYYDLYEDEEEILSPRSKRGKDISGDIDFSDYPMMYDDWHEAECVACCYSNIYGESNKAICRWHAIVAAYGEFNEINYARYFNGVINSNGIPDAAVSELFGSDKIKPKNIVAYCNDHNVGSDWTNVEDENWAVWAKASSGGGKHICKVHSVNIEPYQDDYYLLTIRVVDQTNNGAAHNKYHIYLNSNKKYKCMDDVIIRFIDVR